MPDLHRFPCVQLGGKRFSLPFRERIVFHAFQKARFVCVHALSDHAVKIAGQMADGGADGILTVISCRHNVPDGGTECCRTRKLFKDPTVFVPTQAQGCFFCDRHDRAIIIYMGIVGHLLVRKMDIRRFLRLPSVFAGQ